jgi:xanthine dehydrogenase YagS FAD-binding subunit
MNAFEWTEASSVDQAVAQLGDKGVVLKAGGVDLLDMMKEHLLEPTRLVNIRNIRGLDKIQFDDKAGAKIGPLVTLAQLEADPMVRERYSALADAAGAAATPQIRNMATVGGNLVQRPRCWYFRNETIHCKKKGGDICYAQHGENQYHAIFDNDPCAIVHPSSVGTPLVAYGASLELTSSKGKREVLAEEFFKLPEVDVHRENILEPGEMITEIRIPAPASGTRSAYTKQGEKESQDWPIAEVIVVIEPDGDRVKRASIVLGAASPVPHRAKQAEAVVQGKKIDEALAREAAHAALADAQPLAENGYKVALFEVLIRRTLLRAAGGQA